MLRYGIFVRGSGKVVNLNSGAVTNYATLPAWEVRFYRLRVREITAASHAQKWYRLECKLCFGGIPLESAKTKSFVNRFYVVLFW